MGALNQRALLRICLGIMAVYMAPYFILGPDMHVTIHDNLDSNIVWIKLLLDNNLLFAPMDTVVEPIMGGMPLSSVTPIYTIQLAIFNFFGMYWGYALIRLGMVLVAFFGMRALLRNHLPQAMTPPVIGYGVALCFALLPHWGFSGSVVVLPMLFNAFINIHKRQSNWVDYAAIVVAAACSSLILVGVFFIAVVGVFALYAWAAKKKSPIPIIAGLALLSGVYIATHIRLFAAFLLPDKPISHRTDFERGYNWMGLIFERLNELMAVGWYHAPSAHTLIIPAIILGLYAIWQSRVVDYIYINLLEFLILSSLWYSIIKWRELDFIFDPITAVVPMQLQRFHFLQPVAWYALFALAVFHLVNRGGGWRKVGLTFLVVQIGYVCYFHEGIQNRNAPSFKGFYAEALFEEVKGYLEGDTIRPKSSSAAAQLLRSGGVKPELDSAAAQLLRSANDGDNSMDLSADRTLRNSRSIFVTSHPAVLHYNGIYTLDGYLADYPLEYKREFGKVIAGELERDPGLKRDFENWGSRAYAVSAEKGKEFVHSKDSDSGAIESLDYDWEQFEKMGGVYIFSPVAIKDSDLRLIRIFGHDEAAWDVWLYVVRE